MKQSSNDPQRERLYFFDTTLRDGEQSPGCSMTREEKLTLAHGLADLGVDILEAGFAVSSEGDFNSIFDIAKAVRGPRIASLARARRQDIELAARAVEPAKESRIHVFLASSDLHLEHKLKIAREEALAQVGESVSLARKYVDDVEFSPEDATRSDPEFLRQMVGVAIEAGATTINVPDTVGYSTPEEYGSLFRMLIERVPGADKVIFSSHCHDDLGLAVANSLAAVQGGARQVECTINGIGERAGNAALEEIAAVLHVRGAMAHRLAQLGYELAPSDLDIAYAAFTELADRKKAVYDQDLINLVSHHRRHHDLVGDLLAQPLAKSS